LFSLSAGVPLVALQSQVYGMPVLQYYTCLPANILLDLSASIKRKRNNQFTTERAYQLINYAEAISELILEKYPELECLREMEVMAKEYQFLREELGNWDMKIEERLKKVVGAEDKYCIKIHEIRKKHGLKYAYIFT
jgi:hypothetical protein